VERLHELDRFLDNVSRFHRNRPSANTAARMCCGSRLRTTSACCWTLSPEAGCGRL
jgi:hypothetical protein